MPESEQPQQINANVTRIDAPFPEQWREEMYKFVSEIEAIKKSLDVLNTSIEASSEASNKLSEWYEKGGLSPTASTAGTGKTLVDVYGQPLSGGEAPTQEEIQTRTREELGRQGGGPSYPPGTPEAENKRRTPGESSQEYLENTPIVLPQHYGGKYTTADMLTLLARMTNSYNQSERIGGEPGTGFSNTATNWLVNRAQTTVPAMQAAVGIFGNYVPGLGSPQNWSQELGSFASGLGYRPGEGFLGSNNLNVMGMRFRVPFLNPSTLQGISQFGNAWESAVTTPGLSTEQSMAAMSSIGERGWFQNGELNPSGENLYEVFRNLISKGGSYRQLAENPETMDLVEQATRYGNRSTNEMLKIIEQIPEAAEKAHEGMSQMISDMKDFGEFSKSTGGTRAAGYEQAQEIGEITGEPAAAWMGALNSPWAQSAIFRATGQPSWMQGALPGALKNEIGIKALQQAAKVVGRPNPYTLKDFSGGEYTVSGLQQQAAMIQKFFYPELSPEDIMKKLKNAHANIETAKVQRANFDWKREAESLLRNNASPEEIHRFITGEEVSGHNFGNMLHDMRTLKTAEGRPMFSQEDIRLIRESGKGKEGKELIEARYGEVQKILNTKARKRSENTGSPNHSTVTYELELTPSARKILELPGKKSRMKLEANAGGGTPINHSATGYTDNLIPAGDQSLLSHNPFLPREE